MRKLEESELSEGEGEEDDGTFGTPSLTEAIKQPLFRKSKSQVHACFLQKKMHIHTVFALKCGS